MSILNRFIVLFYSLADSNEDCKVNSTSSLEFTVNKSSPTCHQFAGTLEYYVRFWDENKQTILLGGDLQKCYYTRDLPAESLVSGDETLVVIESTEQYSWLTINGRFTEMIKTMMICCIRVI